MEHLDAFARGLFVVVFGVAAAGKLRSRAAYRAFSASLAAFGFASTRARVGAAAFVTFSEAAVAVLLVADRAVTAAYLLAAGLLAAFAAEILVAVRAGRPARCRCFGGSGARLTGLHAVRNAVLALLAVAVAGGEGATAPPTATYAAVAAGGALTGWAVTRFDDLLFLLGGPRGRRTTLGEP